MAPKSEDYSDFPKLRFESRIANMFAELSWHYTFCTRMLSIKSLEWNLPNRCLSKICISIYIWMRIWHSDREKGRGRGKGKKSRAHTVSRALCNSLLLFSDVITHFKVININENPVGCARLDVRNCFAGRSPVRKAREVHVSRTKKALIQSLDD